MGITDQQSLDRMLNEARAEDYAARSETAQKFLSETRGMFASAFDLEYAQCLMGVIPIINSWTAFI